MTRWIAVTAPLAGAALLAAGCSDVPVEYSYPTRGPGGLPTYEKQEKLTGPDGLYGFRGDALRGMTCRERIIIGRNGVTHRGKRIALR